MPHDDDMMALKPNGAFWRRKERRHPDERPRPKRGGRSR